VLTAPESPAFPGALARAHLDRAERAGRREEVAFRGELEERERLLRRHRAQFLEKSYAVDELDALLRRQARRLAREPARAHEHALAHLRRGHLAAQLAHRLDADGIGAPRLAVQDQRAARGAERFEIGGAQLLEAPPLELL